MEREAYKHIFRAPPAELAAVLTERERFDPDIPLAATPARLIGAERALQLVRLATICWTEVPPSLSCSTLFFDQPGKLLRHF